jgi:hypothetical protein
MNLTEKLMAGIRMKDIKADIQALATKTLNHPHGCHCADCQRFNKDVNGTKDTPATVTEGLLSSFKAIVKREDFNKPVSGRRIHDEQGRRPTAGPKVEDEAGRDRRRKKSPIDAGLSRSMDAILGRER